MAQRRMFSKSVTRTDTFLDMSQGTQNLYFHLGIEADDDGFVSPKMIMRMLGSTTDDLKTLIAKGFVIPFESGVMVIRHWRENNYIQSDRYRPSIYPERTRLLLDENGLYQDEEEYDPTKPDNSGLKRLDTKCIQNVRVGKVRLGKDRVGKVIEYMDSAEDEQKKSSEESSLDEVNDVKSSEQNDMNLVKKVHNTKETYTKYIYMSDLDFAQFWKEYPNHADKKRALAKFKKLKKELLPMILSALEKQKESKQWRSGFIPLPSTWIHNMRWEDEVSADSPDVWAQELVKKYGKEQAMFKFTEKYSNDDMLKYKHIFGL